MVFLSEYIKPKRKPSRKRGKWVLLGGLGFLVLTFCVGYFTYQEVLKTNELKNTTENLVANEPVKVVEKEKTFFDSVAGGMGFSTAEAKEKESDRINVLVMGLDTRDKDLTGRTDVLMLVSLNQVDGQVEMISIPRDTLVSIEGFKKKDKINHAYASGGKDLTISTVENLFDIDIHHYVTFNFQGFIGIIDALGGIEVDVPFDFTEQDSNDVQHAIAFKQGVQTISGEEALAYVRMRKQDPRGDHGRVERQQQVIQAVVTELKSRQSLGTYISLFSEVNKAMETDVGVTDIPSLIKKVGNIKTFNSTSLQGEGVYLSGIYYYEPSSKHISQINALLGNREETSETDKDSDY